MLLSFIITTLILQLIIFIIIFVKYFCFLERFFYFKINLRLIFTQTTQEISETVMNRTKNNMKLISKFFLF